MFSSSLNNFYFFTDILEGSVGILNNYNLCHIKTIEWKEIITGPGAKLLLKMAPDLGDAEIEDLLAAVEETRLAGVVATNTTIETLSEGSMKEQKPEEEPELDGVHLHLLAPFEKEDLG